MFIRRRGIGIQGAFQGERGRCTSVFPRCGVCVLAIVIVAAATDLWAQDGQGYTPGYSAADPNAAPEMSNQPQMAAAGQPKTAENAPPDYSALPPAQDNYECGFGEASCRPGEAVGGLRQSG